VEVDLSVLEQGPDEGVNSRLMGLLIGSEKRFFSWFARMAFDD